MIGLQVFIALYLILKAIKWPSKQGIERWNRFTETQVMIKCIFF
jgi:hypothetical protein